MRRFNIPNKPPRMRGDEVEYWLKLGRYSHRDAADVLGVDYPRVYKWLIGRAYPNRMHEAMIRQDILALKKEIQCNT